MPKLNTYDLYETTTGITADTSRYKHGTPIIRVAAASIKQAYFLAGNEVWIDEDNNTGILEKCDSREADKPWLLFDGTRSSTQHYQHGKGCKRRIAKLLATMAL